MDLRQTRFISVLTIDDHALLREGIAAVIEGVPDFCYVGGAASAQEGLAMFQSAQPDVTLLDIQLPDRSGIELIEEIRREQADARVIMLTTYRGDALARRALAAGAMGYLLKSMLQTDLIAAIRRVHAGSKYIPAEIAQDLSSRIGDEHLSSRELEVLHLVAKGSSNKRIGIELGISEQTVKAHLKQIISKLAASDRTHAVTIALQRGVISF
jgi:Response regulator containing a CheY-like receiver domain and an HTH DNA-binding domain